MARGTNQKLKLSYLTRIMLEKTDDEHSLTMPQIMAELEKYDITAERKSIYADFADMTDKLGIEIIKEQVGRETFYHVGNRQFEIAEIKLLIDAIQASKFITEKKSGELIRKIKSFASEHEAKQLQRQVYVQGRIKTMNESIYYNVDDIHAAINQNKKIKFKYYKWNIKKELVPRHNGDYFYVSPWALAFKQFDMASYTRMNFGMYNGRIEKVKIEFPNSMCGVFIDRFGKNIAFRRIDEEHSYLLVDVAVSYQFFGWIFSLGKEVKVVEPYDVVEKMREAAKEFAANYDK